MLQLMPKNHRSACGYAWLWRK